MLNLEIEVDVVDELNYEKIAKDVINKSLDICGIDYECEINLIITDDKTIHRLNNEYRGIDKKTDVLSFPMLEQEDISNILNDKIYDIYLNNETNEIILGDIIISYDTMISQAKEYGHSIKREYAFLIAHSMLHLLGYDHIEKEEEKKMFALQNTILEELSILR